jgi:putative transposase
MILEVAILNVIEGREKQFEDDFKIAGQYISSIKGYVRHSLRKCIEQQNKYILLVDWENLEDHTIGFRESEQYLEWKKLLHNYYDPFPIVEHFKTMNKYNPKIHHRRSIRLKGYDYSQVGLYFITICCEDRKNRFGTIENKEMILNELGIIAYDEWAKLSERFPNFELDVFQIMPNHIHGIIFLNTEVVGATLAAVAQNDDDIIDKGQPQGIAPTSMTIIVGDIIGAYKSLVANSCLEIFKSKDKIMGELWQRNYYEHIIRNQQAYQRISDYIINNPAKWAEDKFCEE